MFNNVVLNQHTCFLTRLCQQSCVLVTSHQQYSMLHLHPTFRNAGYSCTGSAGMSVQVTSGQCACLFYFLPTSSPGIIATGSADIFTITHAWLCGTGPANMMIPNKLVCNSFTRLAGMLQYPCFKHCLEPSIWHISYN